MCSVSFRCLQIHMDEKRLASADARATTLAVIYLELTEPSLKTLTICRWMWMCQRLFTATRAFCRKHVLTAYENRLPVNRHPREACDSRWRFEAGCRDRRRADLGRPGPVAMRDAPVVMQSRWLC